MDSWNLHEETTEVEDVYICFSNSDESQEFLLSSVERERLCVMVMMMKPCVVEWLFRGKDKETRGQL